MCSKDVLVDDHVRLFIEEIKSFYYLHFCFRQSVSQCHKFSCLMLNSYSVERILSIVFISIFVLGYYMCKPVLAHAHRNGQLL